MWNFFEFKADNDAQVVIICKQCFGNVAAQQGITLHDKHLQRHHKIQYELVMKDKRTT